MQPKLIKSRYEVHRTLGSGGFGKVYLAFDRKLEQWCAVKEIRIDTAEQIDFVMNEVVMLKQCADLSFIPHIYDWSFEDIDPYYKIAYVFMEYIEGTPLNQIQEWSPQTITTFLTTMLDNLAQLHSRGFVHRDIKPANIILSTRNTYVLVDFGIAKSGAGTRSVVRPVATPDFASPEQLYGQSTDERSDLYSLGATAYFLVTRKRISPLTQRSKTHVLEQLRKHRPDIPPSVAQTINAMLQIDANDRPANAQTARDLLHPSSNRSRIMITALVLCVLLGVIFTLGVINRDAVAQTVAQIGEGIGLTRQEAPSRPPFPADQVEAAINTAGGVFGVAVYDVTYDQQIYSDNLDRVFPAASLAKLPIAITTYHLAQQEQINLNQQIALEDEDRASGTGTLQNAPTGSQYTTRELVQHMLSDSDNTAGNMLLRHIGFEAVNSLMNQLGAGQTRVQRLFGDEGARATGSDNITSPQDMQILLLALVRDDILDANSRNEILDALRQSASDGKLAAGLPDSVDLAHKTGVLNGIEHDVGIVTLPDQQQYIIVVQSANLPDAAIGRAAIAQTSRIVYEWFEQ